MYYSANTNTNNIGSLAIKYGLDQQRLYQTSTLENGTTKEKYFIGGLYEKEISEGVIKELCYISTPAGTIAIKETQDNVDNWLFLTHDHLGSVHCILNENGDLEQELSFDPYGNRRDPNTWKPFEDGTEPTYIIDRGYTFHEHWDDFGLINMNGRVYDPVIARFLSPDPYVQSPGYSQNFNRYSYVLNNPLKYTDPSGEWINFAIGAVIGGIQGYMVGRSAGLKGWGMAGAILGGAVIGAGAAGIGTAISSSVSGAGGVILAGSTAGAAGMSSFNSMAVMANDGNIGQMGQAHIDGVWKGTVTGAVGGYLSGGIGGGWGASIGASAAGGIGAALNNGSATDIIKGAAYGGILGAGLYHISMGAAYQEYKNSGITFDGKTLSYRQFNGVSSEFQKSQFWKEERGSYLVGKKFIKYPSWTRHIYFVDIPQSAVDADSWATFHTHWDSPGKSVTINGRPYTTVQHHSQMDTDGDNSIHISSLVLNPIDASFHSYSDHSVMTFSSSFVRSPISLLYFGL